MGHWHADRLGKREECRMYWTLGDIKDNDDLEKVLNLKWQDDAFKAASIKEKFPGQRGGCRSMFT